VPFQGKSCLKWNWEKVQPLSPDHALCNTHYHPEPVRTEAAGMQIETIHEPAIMGTGGCLGNAGSILSQTDMFLIHNADIMHNINLPELCRYHIKSGAIATLAACHRPRVNTLLVNEDNCLAGIKNYYQGELHSGISALTYTGIALYSRQFLDFCKNKPADIKEFWVKALKKGQQISIFNCGTSPWFDFGQPQGLWDTAQWVMEQTGNFNYQYPVSGNLPSGCHIGKAGAPGYTTAMPCTPAHVNNEAGIKYLPPDLTNTLIYEKPEKDIPAGTGNCIIGRDFFWKIVAGGNRDS
jgi:NDP-sugar pyrophosphorylase family protein